MEAEAAHVHQEIADLFLQYAPSAKMYEHPASKTSEESMKVRQQASGELVTGAKAILLKLDIKGKDDTFAVIVLPGFNRLDSKRLKEQLKQYISDLRGFRFASPEEMARVARGTQPGKMPPIGRPIFPAIAYTFIDTALLEHPKVGFNAAHFERSIILPTSELLALVPHDAVITCSIPPESA